MRILWSEVGRRIQREGQKQSRQLVQPCREGAVTPTRASVRNLEKAGSWVFVNPDSRSLVDGYSQEALE